MDILRKLAKKDVGPTREVTAQKPPEAPKPEAPHNVLESTVQQAPPVLETARKTEEQLRAEALHTMEIMEAARADKGPFCVTLGQGDSRTILLVAPEERKEEAPIQVGGDYHYITYYLITPSGVKSLTLTSLVGSKNPEWEKKRVIASKTFQEIVEEATREDPNLTNSGFTEKRREGGEKHHELHLISPINPDKKVSVSSDPASEYKVGVRSSTDEAVHLSVLKKSLAKVQAPVQAQIANARAQITTLGGMRDGLK